MPPKKKTISRKSPSVPKRTARKRIVKETSSDHVPQLAAVIVADTPMHVVVLGHAAKVLNKIYLVSCGSVLALALLLGGMTSFASTVSITHTKTQGPLAEIGTTIGTANDAPTLIANVIKAFFGLLGLLFVILIIYGGFLWMTDNGDEKQVGHAKNIIKNSTAGLIITVLAFAISNYVIGLLATSV